MSRFNNRFLAALPLFAIMALSPMALKAHASLMDDMDYPKYEDLKTELDQTEINKKVQKDINLSDFSHKAEGIRADLKKLRKEYDVDETDKVKVEAQNKRITDLAVELAALEEDKCYLEERKAWSDDFAKKVATNSMNELKITLESLLVDKVENELKVAQAELKDLKDKKGVAQTEEEKKAEAEKKVKEDKEAEDKKHNCAFEEKYEEATKQIEELLAEQKKILGNLATMNQSVAQADIQHQRELSWAPYQSTAAWNPYTLYPQFHESAGGPVYNIAAGATVAIGGNAGNNSYLPGQNSDFNQFRGGNTQDPFQTSMYQPTSSWMQDPQRFFSPRLGGSLGGAGYNFGGDYRGSFAGNFSNLYGGMNNFGGGYNNFGNGYNNPFNSFGNGFGSGYGNTFGGNYNNFGGAIGNGSGTFGSNYRSMF